MTEDQSVLNCESKCKVIISKEIKYLEIKLKHTKLLQKVRHFIGQFKTSF